MNFLTKYFDTTQVTCIDGRIVPCNYLDSSDFSLSNELCAALHYVFITYSKGVTYARSYSVRTGLNSFLKFMSSYNQNQIIQLQLLSYSDLIPEVIGQFELYCKKNKLPKDNASRLFGSFRNVALNNDDGLPLLSDYKFKNKSKPNVNEPLTLKGFNQLVNLLQAQVDLIYKKLIFRKEVEALDPYTLDDINALMALNKAQFSDNLDWFWKPDDIRALQTLVYYNFPFCMSLEEFLDWWHSKDESLPIKFNHTEVAKVVFFTYKFASRKKAKISSVLGHPVDLLSMYYPTSEEQAVLAIFICLQTGWNKETVMNIDPDNFEQILSGSLDENHVLLISEKEKSQSTNKPYYSPKSLLAPSDKSDKYSAYNLIMLAKELSAPLYGLERENYASSDLHYPKLFLCLKRNTSFTSRNTINSDNPVGRFGSIGNKSTWSSSVKTLLSKIPISDTRGIITTAKELTARLRPTWIKFVRDTHNSPLSLIALQQGHSSINTTDIHYDNSSLARQKRKERLTIELLAITKSIKHRRFKGLVHKIKAQKSNAKKLRFFNLPNHDRVLWACQNSYNPDFPEHGEIMVDGQKCFEISKCLFCSQVRIFEDSLPFLLSREDSIRLMMSESSELPNDTQEEFEIIQYILNEWNDETALKSAARYFRRNAPLLPADMNLLKVIFED